MSTDVRESPFLWNSHYQIIIESQFPLYRYHRIRSSKQALLVPRNSPLQLTIFHNIQSAGDNNNYNDTSTCQGTCLGKTHWWGIGQIAMTLVGFPIIKDCLYISLDSVGCTVRFHSDNLCDIFFLAGN